MPISSKRIISHINNLNSSFTAQQISKELLSNKKEKKDKLKKKKKIKGSREQEAFYKIGIVLKALVVLGVLEKNRKIYCKNLKYRLCGKIKINSSGNGILITDDGDEIVIKKDFINNARNNDAIEVEIIDFRNGIYFGNIIKIIQRRREQYFARVEHRTEKLVYFKLLDTMGDRNVCSKRLEEDDENFAYAMVRLIDNVISGRQECIVENIFKSEEGYDVQRIIIKHSLPGEHKEYAELQNIEGRIPEAEFHNRKDYRDLFTITIDGERAKDFDDAISLETNESKVKLYIHIADVSSFVKKDSELDLEALSRGTSYYLGNCVIPMLPEILSNDLCSLKMGEERLTLSVEIIFDINGNEIECSFHRGLIKVDHRMTYVSADKAMHENKNIKLNKILKQMYNLACALKQKRFISGRIDLNLPDYELIFEKDDLIDIEFAVRLKSHVVIEEFMLSANEVVSRALTQKNIPSLYRIHEDIDKDKVLALRNFLKSLGLTLTEKMNIGAALQKVIDIVNGKEYENVVNFIILKSFMQAYYGVEPLGHFGLGFEDYTHFTSPIRRYPDLIVHRCLKDYIDLVNGRQTSYKNSELETIGESCSTLERVAQYAERDLFKLISCRFMRDKIGEEFDAVISGIAKSGFYVTLVEKPIEGMVPLRFLTDDYYLALEDEYTVMGKRRGKRYRIGDNLKVRLEDVTYETMHIDFDVV